MKDWIKKNLAWVIVIILLIISLAFIAYKLYQSNIEKAQLSGKNEQLQGSLQEEKNAANLYFHQLDTCEHGIPRPTPVAVAVVQAQPEMVAAPQPQLVAKKRTPKKSVKRQDVEEVQFTQSSFAPVRSSAPAPVRTETNYAADNNSLPITNYEGDINGDFGTTIDANGHLIYFIKASVIANNKGNTAPRLNGEHGSPFTLDKSSGYWFYVDQRLISGQEINSSGYAVIWNIFIGQVNYGTGSYPAFLPHQSIKPLLNKVRGFEYGEITKEDLAEMGKDNSHIANGTIRPLRLSSSPGHDNAQFWHGWNFVTKIYAKKKTVTQ